MDLLLLFFGADGASFCTGFALGTGRGDGFAAAFLLVDVALEGWACLFTGGRYEVFGFALLGLITGCGKDSS